MLTSSRAQYGTLIGYQSARSRVLQVAQSCLFAARQQYSVKHQPDHQGRSAQQRQRRSEDRCGEPGHQAGLGDLPDDRHSQDDRDDVQDDREHPVEEQRAFVAEERPDEAEDPKTVVIRAELALAPDRAIFEADLDLDPADIVLTARRDSARELFSCRPEPGREGHPARHIAVRFRVGVDVNGRPPPVREQLVADVLREPHIIAGGHEARLRPLVHLVVVAVTRVHPYHPGLVTHGVRVDGRTSPGPRPVGGDAVYVIGVEPVRERAPDGGRVRLRLPPEAVPGRR